MDSNSQNHRKTPQEYFGMLEDLDHVRVMAHPSWNFITLALVAHTNQLHNFLLGDERLIDSGFPPSTIHRLTALGFTGVTHPSSVSRAELPYEMRDTSTNAVRGGTQDSILLLLSKPCHSIEEYKRSFLPNVRF